MAAKYVMQDIYYKYISYIDILFFCKQIYDIDKHGF